MRDKVKNDSDTIHVKVIVTETISGYSAEFEPKIINVDDNDTILSFRLDTPTPDNVVIDKVRIKQLGQDQLSKPSISQNGKRAILTDENTLKGQFNLQFTFKQKGTEIDSMARDAEIAALARDAEDKEMDSTQYPIIINNPP